MNRVNQKICGIAGMLAVIAVMLIFSGAVPASAADTRNVSSYRSYQNSKYIIQSCLTSSPIASAPD